MLESSRYVICLLLDFSKAFDTVDHLQLLIKLRVYHLPSNILSKKENMKIDVALIVSLWSMQGVGKLNDNEKHGEWEGLNEVAMQKIIQANEWGLANNSKNE